MKKGRRTRRFHLSRRLRRTSKIAALSALGVFGGVGALGAARQLLKNRMLLSHLAKTLPMKRSLARAGMG